MLFVYSRAGVGEVLSVYNRGCRERCYLFTAGGVG